MEKTQKISHAAVCHPRPRLFKVNLESSNLTKLLPVTGADSQNIASNGRVDRDAANTSAKVTLLCQRVATSLNDSVRHLVTVSSAPSSIAVVEPFRCCTTNFRTCRGSSPTPPWTGCARKSAVLEILIEAVVFILADREREPTKAKSNAAPKQTGRRNSGKYRLVIMNFIRSFATCTCPHHLECNRNAFSLYRKWSRLR